MPQQTQCPDCQQLYPITEQQCPYCGGPNDNWTPPIPPQPEVNTTQQEASQQEATQQGVDAQQCAHCDETVRQQRFEEKLAADAQQEANHFNEGPRYSPLSKITDPWPIRKYAQGEFAKAHPFWGWFFGPWHLTPNEENKEQYDTINNIFYLFNLFYKSHIFVAFWMFFKGWWIIVLYFFILFLTGRSIAKAVTYEELMSAQYFALFITFVFYICGVILFFKAWCRALHRYWPSFHRTWRRICQRFAHNTKNV